VPDLFICAKHLFVAAMATTDGRQELRRRLICCLVAQLGGAREMIRRRDPSSSNVGLEDSLTSSLHRAASSLCEPRTASVVRFCPTTACPPPLHATSLSDAPSSSGRCRRFSCLNFSTFQCCAPRQGRNTIETILAVDETMLLRAIKEQWFVLPHDLRDLGDFPINRV
jgi:hypothetical protein